MTAIVVTDKNRKELLLGLADRTLVNLANERAFLTQIRADAREMEALLGRIAADIPPFEVETRLAVRRVRLGAGVMRQICEERLREIPRGEAELRELRAKVALYD